MYVIYKLTSPSGKVYIGKASNFKARMQAHGKNASLGKLSHLYTSIRKYGWENFTKEIIENIEDASQLNQREIFWIDYYNSYLDKTKGYNMTPGGDGGNTLIAWTEEEKKKLWATQSDKRKGMTRSEETKQRMSAAGRARDPTSAETRRKISETNKRKGIHPPIHHNGNGGYKHTAKERERLRQARLNKTYEELFSAEKSQELKEIHRKMWAKENNPNYVDFSKEQKQTLLLALSQKKLSMKDCCELVHLSPYKIRSFFKQLDIKNFQRFRQASTEQEWISFFQKELINEFS